MSKVDDRVIEDGVLLTSQAASLIEPFTAQMQALCGAVPGDSHLAIAVSGGADSMALALLTQQWAQARSCTVTALIVDHRLRPDSTQEAQQAGAWLHAQGIDHQILTWEDCHSGLRTAQYRAPDPGTRSSEAGMTLPKTQHNTTTSNLQARARAARYRLLTQWCHAHDVSDLLLAHHLDDQAETFLMRLARGSGVDGLSCMQACTERDGIRLLRPLLNVRKTTLVDYLTQRNQRWLEDPSNHNPAFSRTHIRTWLAQQEAPGISAGNLAVTGARMQRARDALEHYTVDALTRHARIYEEGCATLNPQALRTLPEEIGLRLLSHLLCVVGGQHYRHRFEQLEAVFSAVKTEAPFTTRTFGGCLLKRHDQRLWILREVSACAAPSALLSGQEMHWDRRYRIQIASAMHLKNTLQIAPLSAAGWHVARRASRCNSTRSIPREAFYALPAVMRDEEPIAIPHMGWYADPRMKGHIIVRFSPPKLLPGHRYHVLMGGN